MTTREPTDASELAAVTRQAVARLDAEIAAARPVPDFSAMLSRARELAPELVSEADVTRAGALAPVLPLARRDRRAERAEAAALAPFIAALRAELEATIAERRMAGIPPLPLPAPRRRFAPALARRAGAITSSTTRKALTAIAPRRRSASDQ